MTLTLAGPLDARTYAYCGLRALISMGLVLAAEATNTVLR